MCCSPGHPGHPRREEEEEGGRGDTGPEEGQAQGAGASDSEPGASRARPIRSTGQGVIGRPGMQECGRTGKKAGQDANQGLDL